MSSHHDFLVGTFNTPQLYTLRFTPPSSNSPTTGSLTIIHRSSAIGSHSWLHLNPARPNGTRTLYATAWTEPPSVVVYTIHSPTQIDLLGSAPTQSRSGYVCASSTAVYSAGGATGEVFNIDPETGNFTSTSPDPSTTTTTTTATAKTIQPLQTLSFIDTQQQRDDGSTMDFGGLRHGAHSADLSPSHKALYVADIGRNCIWTFAVSPSDGKLALGEKHISPRPNDGPRHVHPHPASHHVYSLQEHTSIVDVFATDEAGVHLTHVQAVRIIPAHEHERDYWADEVRTSLSNGDAPRYLYASTRGLTPGKKGFVAVYRLREDGTVDDSTITSNGTSQTEAKSNGTESKANGDIADLYAGLLCMYETPTSGGWANAIQPGPTVDGIEYLALTDSEEGCVFVLSWDGSQIREVARTKLDPGAGAATAVWL